MAGQYLMPHKFHLALHFWCYCGCILIPLGSVGRWSIIRVPGLWEVSLQKDNEYFPFTRISKPVHILLTEVRSFLGPKFFCLWTTTIRLTPIGNLVPGYQEFPVAPSETIVGLVKKIRSPTWGMARQWLLGKICLVVDYLTKSTFTYHNAILISNYLSFFSNLEFQNPQVRNNLNSHFFHRPTTDLRELCSRLLQWALKIFPIS